MGELTRRYGMGLTLAMCLATFVWLMVMVVLPYFVMVEYSFHPNLTVVEIGGPRTTTPLRTIHRCLRASIS